MRPPARPRGPAGRSSRTGPNARRWRRGAASVARPSRTGGRRDSWRLRAACRRPPDGLAGRQAGTDHARRAQRFVRGAHAAAGHEEVVDVAGLQATERDVVVRPLVEPLVRGSEPSFFPELDRPARAGDAVVELAGAQHVVAGELVAPDHPAALADA